MRSFFNLVAVALSAVLFFSCTGGNSNWSRYTSGEGGFSVNMPGKPEKTDKVLVTAFGKQKVNFVSWKPSALAIDKFKLFQVSFTNCPAQYGTDTVMRDYMLDSCIRMRKKDFTEKVDFPAETIELNGYPGRAFIFDGGGTIVNVKQCIANGKLYDLTVISKSDQSTNAEISEFFNSFQPLLQ